MENEIITKIKDLQKKKSAAYNDWQKAVESWKNAIKEALTGVEKEVFDKHNEEEFSGVETMLTSYGYGVDAIVDKVTYDEEHKMFKFHVVSMDYKEADMWIFERDATHTIARVNRILKFIVW